MIRLEFDSMNRLLVFAVLALAVVYQVSGVPRQPEEPPDVTSVHCGMLRELRQVVADNPGIQKRSPKNWWCGTVLSQRMEALCSCTHHAYVADDKFLDDRTAKGFLKRATRAVTEELPEECCSEGCYYEEAYESC